MTDAQIAADGPGALRPGRLVEGGRGWRGGGVVTFPGGAGDRGRHFPAAPPSGLTARPGSSHSRLGPQPGDSLPESGARGMNPAGPAPVLRLKMSKRTGEARE